MNVSSVYYFFSTLTQAVASVTGISATIVVFRYQALNSDISVKLKHIAGLFDETTTAYNSLDSEAKNKLNKFNSVREEVAFFRDYFYDKQGEVRPEQILHLEQLAPGSSVVANVRDIWQDFKGLDELDSNLSELKCHATAISTFGLTLILAGGVLTLSPEWLCKDQMCANTCIYILGYLVACCVFSILIILAFRAGLKKQF